MTFASRILAVICHTTHPAHERLAQPPGGRGRAKRLAASRGFTLIEMLAAVALIGLLAAAASPSFVRLMQDQRVASSATNIADLYRLARARALGRGSAVLVRFDDGAALPTTSSPAGHVTMREAITGTGGDCAPTPSPSCTTTNWADDSTNSKFVMSFDERSGQYDPAQAAFVDPAGSDAAYAEICFTPRGRAFIRYSTASAFVPLSGVPRVDVTNTRTTMVRRVLILPNGNARVVTRL